MKKELVGTEFEQTNDIEKYCGCMTDEYKKYPISQIMEVGFKESELGVSIDKKCTEKSKK